jgi:hypothetical protein
MKNNPLKTKAMFNPEGYKHRNWIQQIFKANHTIVELTLEMSVRKIIGDRSSRVLCNIQFYIFILI